MDIVVFGAGSLGSFVGGLLSKKHTVTLVGRDPHIETVIESGLQIVGAIEATATPTALTDGANLDADLAIVTVKSFDTQEAADTLATGSYDTVLSLQNGMGNEEILYNTLTSAHILAGTTTYGALIRSPGVVQCAGLGTILLGPWQGGESVEAEMVAKAFRSVTLSCTTDADMPYRLWEKLAINSAINPVTALSRCRNGALALEPASIIAERAAREVALVARENDIDLTDNAAVESLHQVIEDTAANTSSMAYDVANNRRTEIASINGFVVDTAEDPDLVPVNATLAALVQVWEQDHDIGVQFDNG